MPAEPVEAASQGACPEDALANAEAATAAVLLQQWTAEAPGDFA